MTDDLILRSLDGELSPDEEASLRLWRQAAPEHERRYQQLAALARALEAGGRRRRGVPRPTAAQLLRRARRAAALRAARRGAAWTVPLAAAAGLLFVIGRWNGGSGTPASADGASLTEVVTGPNEASTARLADGSIVRLAPNSRLALSPRGAREVWIEGTAFLAVARRSGAPFVVRTSAGTATVLGTRFELRASDAELRVVVVEGTVAVRDARREIRVHAGEMTFVGRGAPAAVTRVSNPRAMAGWLGRTLLFQDTPLAEAAREIEEQYDIEVRLADSALGGHLVTGSFPEQPVEAVLQVVCQVVDLECSFDAGRATLRRKP